MKRYLLNISIAALAALSVSSCGEKKSEARIEREKWLLSLNDSIAEYKSHIETATMQLTALQSHIGELLVDFEHVSNPRLVEGYYIYKGWSSRYPLKQTGVVARITEGEGFELIAALSGAHFNQIRVETPSGFAETDIVPHDQALNYRAGNLNTVCFYGNAADSVGQLIAGNENEKITVIFLNGGKTGSYLIPTDTKKMLTATWKLFDAQRESHHLEKEIPMYSRRIDACRRMLEANDTTSSD